MNYYTIWVWLFDIVEQRNIYGSQTGIASRNGRNDESFSISSQATGKFVDNIEIESESA